MKQISEIVDEVDYTESSPDYASSLASIGLTFKYEVGEHQDVLIDGIEMTVIILSREMKILYKPENNHISGINHYGVEALINQEIYDRILSEAEISVGVTLLENRRMRELNAKNDGNDPDLMRSVLEKHGVEFRYQIGTRFIRGTRYLEVKHRQAEIVVNPETFEVKVKKVYKLAGIDQNLQDGVARNMWRREEEELNDFKLV